MSIYGHIVFGSFIFCLIQKTNKKVQEPLAVNRALEMRVFGIFKLFGIIRPKLLGVAAARALVGSWGPRPPQKFLHGS